MQPKEPKVAAASDYYLHLPSAAASRIYLYPVSVGYFYYESGYQLNRNNYDSFLLMQIINGSCTVKIDGKDHIASKGQFVLLDCHQPHEYGFPENSEALWIHFCGPLSQNYYDLITAGNGNILSPENEYPVAHAMAKILACFRESAPVRESVISGHLTHALDELLNAQRESRNHPPHSQVVENSLTYINDHFSEELTLESLAKNANLSPYYFTRVFTSETGLTPHQYLIATRLNSAKFLLKAPGMSIKEIAFSSGFNSESNFCSTFKKWENMTPSEYRARAFTIEPEQ